jgi:GntR family transcriptional repressor for pyruvate dehydrogenase complex
MDLPREDTMADLVGVRRILEPAATAMAATRISAEDLVRLHSFIRPELGDEQARAHVELDWEFHHAIAYASGNELLVALLDGLTAPTMRMRIWRGLSVPGIIDRTLAEHQAIIDALEAHDANLAHAAATVHIASVEAWVRSLEPGWSALAAHEVGAIRAANDSAQHGLASRADGDPASESSTDLISGVSP